MLVAANLKDTLELRLKSEAIAVAPASEAEYLKIAPQFTTKIEYHNSEIIAMGLASYKYEKIVAKLIQLLSNLFSNDQDTDILRSNTGIHLDKFEGGYYQPDVLVVKGDPIFNENTQSILTNPYIIVEVLSSSTHNYDFENKLPEYKQFESLHQIIYVDQKKVFVSVFSKTNLPGIWLNEDLYNLDDSFKVEGKSIFLKDIYNKISF